MASSSSLNSTIQISFGIVHGIFLAIALPLLYVLIPNVSNNFHLIFLFAVLPVLSYFGGMGLNAFSQYISCGKVSPYQVSLVSLICPAFVIGFSALALLIPVIRSPVESILPVSADANMKYALGISFFLLWSGIYGQNLSSGMIQGC